MSIILFIFILLVLIVAHEFGHFIVAKKFGIRVDEFGIGFPPRAMTWMKKGETIYTLNWIPFGGFVKIFGENPSEESLTGPDSSRSFVHKPKWVQASVLVAGVVFNMILAWILLSSIFLIGTDIAISDEQEKYATDIRLVISSVYDESPAKEVGLLPGDTIVSLRGGADTLQEFTPVAASEFIAQHTEEQLVLEVSREDEIIEISVLAEAGHVPDDLDRKILGIGMGTIGFLKYSNPFLALYEGGKFTLDMTGFVWRGLAGFFAGIATFNADFSEVAGPIGIVGVVGEAASVGLTSILFLTALISINLAIINILPIPALDGGRLLFLIIEVVKGSPIKPSVANAIHSIFFIGLIGLVLIVSFFDISKLLG